VHKRHISNTWGQAMANPLPLIYSAWRCDCFRQIIQGEDVYRGDDRLPGCANVLATCV